MTDRQVVMHVNSVVTSKGPKIFSISSHLRPVENKVKQIGSTPVKDCEVQRQFSTSYSGVGAHHQVLAERHIQTIFNWSRANLLHFVLHWPQMATNQENLWPFAIDYAVYMY